MTRIMSGTQRSKEIMVELIEKTKQLRSKYNVIPKLVVITVGEDPASQVYVGQKQKKAKLIGFDFEWKTFSEQTTQEVLISEIEKLNQDMLINGIIVQLPLPKHLNEKEIIDIISPMKDVDGFHPINMGNLVANCSVVQPCTPKGIIDLLIANEIQLEGKNVAIIGRSLIVGLPLQLLMTHYNATVTLCHTKTKDLSIYTKMADIVVVAAGRPGLITADYLKDDAIVIDVGINRLANGKLVGDVDFETVKEKVSAITPVPGGVGPMTVAMLMEQTLQCTCLQNNIDYQTL